MPAFSGTETTTQVIEHTHTYIYTVNLSRKLQSPKRLVRKQASTEKIIPCKYGNLPTESKQLPTKKAE
jgi:hypothetical protein